MASSSGNKDQDKGFSGNRVPSWDGRPESFHHYVIEVKWHLAGMKSSERPYAAARLVRRILESEYPALKTLVYKLDPSDFTTEDAVQRLISFLEASPMNRQPIPDAGRKLTAYYRRLQRKPQETIPQFLIREETLYDEMWRSLQRLLKEKQIDFDQYDCSLTELKQFCGIKEGQSVYIPGGSRVPSEAPLDPDQEFVGENPFEGPDGVPPTPPGSDAPSTVPIGASPPRPASRHFDLIERLMQKGLIPLAALDIIRGWLVLESTSATELDKSLVKASTQNKLGYANIRSALLALHEDRSRGHLGGVKGQSKGKFNLHYGEDYPIQEEVHYGESGYEDDYGYYNDWFDSHDEQGYYGENFPAEVYDQSQDADDNPMNPDPSEEQALNVVSQLEEEEKELAAMMADAQRNLEQARKAVAEAKKDRGWKPQTQSVSSSPKPFPMGPRPTSTFMKGGKGRMQNHFMQRGKGSFSYRPQSGFSRPPGTWHPPQNRFPPRKAPGAGFTQNHSGMFLENDGYQFMTMTEMIPEDEACEKYPFFPVDHAKGISTELKPEEAIIDSGATVSAGGQEAVNQLVGTLASLRPDMNVTVVTTDRPYFRYGSGRWGQALFLVKLHFGGQFSMRIYSLPSPGVPVLVGMREIQELKLIINTVNGHALLLDQPRKLTVTKKKQILLNFLTDLPAPRLVSSPPVSSLAQRDANHFSRKNFTAATQSSAAPTSSGQTCRATKGSQHGLLMLEFLHEPNTDEHSIYVTQDSHSDDCLNSGFFSASAHLQVSDTQFQFLRDEPSLSSQFAVQTTSRVDFQHVHPEPRDGKACEGCSSEGIGRNPEVSDDLHQGQKEVQDSRLGYHSIGGRTNSRPPKLQGLLAVHGSTSSESLRKPMGQVGGVRTVRISPFVHTDKGIPSRVNSHATSQQCDSSFGSPENRRIPSSRLHRPSGQECDQVRGFTGESEISQVQYKHLEGQDQGLPDKAGEESLKCSRRDPNPLRRRQRQLPSDSEREEEQGTDNVNSMNPFLHSLGKEAVEPAEELETTPEEVLRKLSESLADKIFHIEKELQLLQQKHLVLWEICCAPNSTLTEEMIRNGFQSVRWNYESQFDLEKMDCVQKAIEAIPAQRPSKIWASLRCTPWISIQNLNQKTPQQVENPQEDETSLPKASSSCSQNFQGSIGV